MDNKNKKLIEKFGWAFLGVIGGIAALVGYMIKNAGKFKHSLLGSHKSKDFALSLIVLVAGVIKAHGKVMKSELTYVKDFFILNFGKDSASEAILVLRELLKQEIPLIKVTKQISQNTSYPAKLQLLHFLFGVSNADGQIDEKELDILQLLATNLDIDIRDYESIKSMFLNDVNSAYKVLDVDVYASVEDIKKAFRRMAIKYHPDKVSHLGEDFQFSAKNKFQKLIDAYEKIKKEKGF